MGGVRAVVATAVVFGAACSGTSNEPRIDPSRVTYETLLADGDPEASDFRQSPTGAVFARDNTDTVSRLADGGWIEREFLSPQGAMEFAWCDDFLTHEPLAWAGPFTTFVWWENRLWTSGIAGAPPFHRLRGRDATGGYWFAAVTTSPSEPPFVRFTRVQSTDAGIDAHLVPVTTFTLANDATTRTRLLSDGRFLLLSVEGLLEFSPLEERLSTRIECTHPLFGGRLCTAPVELGAARNGAAFLLDPSLALWRLEATGEPVRVVKGDLPGLSASASVSHRSLYVDPFDRAWLAVEWSFGGETGRALYVAEPALADTWRQLVDRLPGEPTLAGAGDTPLIVGKSASGGSRVVRPVIK